MLFSSLEFLYFFLPLSVGLYFICPMRSRNALLLVFSLLFYGFGEPLYVFLMIFTIVMDYGFGIVIERAKKHKRRWLALAVVCNLSLLFFFKYYDPLAAFFGLPTLGLSLPLGISFYTFQAMSYVVDVYRREVRAQRDLVAFGTYVSMYPQLVAGPIVRYRDIDRELRERRHSVHEVAEGIATFSAGLSKKVLFANGAGKLAEELLTAKESTAALWLGLVAYSFQIYYDFSGYSDMAVGLGRIFGFTFPKNFNYPYISASITEFWRRWHITLSSWFREYVYIPLGGNRRGRLRTYLNLLCVWLLTGVWHGASRNFLLWGLYFFVILALEKAFVLKLLSFLPRTVGHVYALLLIALGWLIFYSDSGSVISIGADISSLFGFGALPLTNKGFGYTLLTNLPTLCFMCLGATPLPKRIYDRILRKNPIFGSALQTLLVLLSLIFSTAYLADSGFNPFLYFRF